MAKAKDKKWAALYGAADQGGRAKAEANTPKPMHIKGYAPIMGGVCGFAWVNVTPGTSSFARWLKKNKDGYKDYYGGISVWTRGYGQSMSKKEAYARGFAEVLRGAGINARMGSRID